jgi:maleate cis-trans isomerase
MATAYGSRGRIGHICPSIPLDMIIDEFNMILPDGVQGVYTSLYIERLQQSDFDRAIARLDEAAGHMVEGEAQSIIVGGGPVVAALGSDEAVVERTYAVARVPTQSTTGAMLTAMQQLGVKKLAIATPYTDERNALLRKYVESQGYTVVGAKGLQLSRAMDMARLPFEDAYRLGVDAARDFPEAEALYMPSARMPLVRSIERIERDTGRPIVTSTQAMVWWGLRAMGIDDRIEGFGRLLREPLPENAPRATVGASA